jgi:hypothetical protein
VKPRPFSGGRRGWWQADDITVFEILVFGVGGWIVTDFVARLVIALTGFERIAFGLGGFAFALLSVAAWRRCHH